MVETFSLSSDANSVGFGLLALGTVVVVLGTFFKNKTEGVSIQSNVSWTSVLMGVCCICIGHAVLFLYD